MMNKKPHVFLMVGVPGSGKSTYIQNVLVNQYPDAAIISTDYFVEKFARRYKLTYNDVFDNCINRATLLMYARLGRAVSNHRDLIWDQTNLSVKARKSKIKSLTNYHKIAVVFETPNHDELHYRLNSRPDKTIPPHILESMIKQFQIPSLDEGFDSIIFVNNNA